MMNKRNLGTFYEDIAAGYINNHGGKVIKRNFRTRQGEIDIIARDGDYLCFVEVKYRATSKAGSSLDAVTPSKQRKICQAALFYMNQKRINPETMNIRFDVVGIDGDKITHIENAFLYYV